MNIADFLNNEQHPIQPTQDEISQDEELDNTVVSNNVSPSGNQQQPAPRRSRNWTETEEQRLIEYFKCALPVTNMASYQNSGRRMQTDNRIWEAKLLERKFRNMKANFRGLYDRFKATGRNGVAPNMAYKHYKILWDCLEGDPQTMPLSIFSSGSQTLTVNSSDGNNDEEPEPSGPVTDEERELLINYVLGSAGRPTRRNFEAMMKSNGVEPTRNTRRRTNNSDVRNKQVIETIQQINEETHKKLWKSVAQIKLRVSSKIAWKEVVIGLIAR
ncbi:hypothetical protein INT47_007833 [Mucor saturninus]|uniref:Uncharacterized protein n=1 Tax=Mucor saturninus TaxID=64648 RepID=A0A8H7VBW3_9FUNG|nr:hypothetical protein INT47_007833 [Mucor saturninus]